MLELGILFHLKSSSNLPKHDEFEVGSAQVKTPFGEILH